MKVDIEFTTNIEAPLWDSLSPNLFIFDPYMAIYYINWIGRSNLQKIYSKSNATRITDLVKYTVDIHFICQNNEKNFETLKM